MKKHALIYAFLLILTTIAVSCKKDTEVNKDTFKIENEKVEVSTQSVKITGTYAYLGAIDGITLELGRQADLMDGDAYRTLLEGTDFSVEVKNLRTNTTYYYRYSVDYGGKAPYRTEIKTFKTEEYNLPEVKSKEVVSVGVNRAEVSGEVLSDGGGDAVTLRGICWSMSHNPSVGDEYANAGEGIGTFTCELTNLQSEKTYYARAFAGNSKGVSYGEELTFVTLAAGSLAEVKTIGITGNANLQATVSGEVTNEGASAVIERGVCYGKEHFPTTSGLHVNAGSGTGEFSCQLTNLEANATYYVRAYAINGQGISYGDEMSFEAQTEVTVPVVFTGMVSDITVSSATGHGTVVSDGGATVTRRGLCWSTEHEPTTGNIYADCGNGVGEFSGLMPHLTDLMTYYVRAYAENSIGMSYGEEVSFTVGQHEHPEPPTVTTYDVTDISATTAVGGGNVINDGGAEVTERGVCWSTNPDPTMEDSHTSNGTGTGIYTVMMIDLMPNTTYYVKSYAINNVGLSYGEEVEFTTEAELPSVTTLPVSDITQTSATCGGNVTDDGGAEVTERGLCWSTDHNPTTDGNHTTSGTGIGTYTVILNDLTPNATYYVRAYAINSKGLNYGGEESFVTSDLPQYNINVAANPSEGGAVSGGGTYQEGQSCTVTATVNSGYTFINWTENGSVVSTNSSYTFEVISNRSLVANFEINTYTISVSANPNNGGAVSGGGTYQEGQSCTVTATVNSGYTFINWTENGSVVSTNSSYTFEVISNRSLVANFEINTYTISVSANPNNGGTVSGGGTYQHGQSCTVTAAANNGYSFDNWAENGNAVSSNASYTFMVTGNRSLVANFSVSSPGDEFFVDFESGMPADWITIDADGDGYGWRVGSELMSGVNGHNSSVDFVFSQSYDNTYGVLYPDNYLISPQVLLGSGSTFSFYACAQDANYAAEHFGVAVSTTGTSPSNFTIVQEWTMTAKGSGMSTNHTRSGNRDQGTWYQYTVDLSAYAGQQVYIAIRHFNCSDMFYLDVDDVVLSNAKK